MRVETGIAASYGGSFPRLPPSVAPVAHSDAPVAVRAAPVTYTPERLEAARHMAAAIAVSTGVDTTGLALRARHAVQAYSMVRDGDRREYLHRVFGLEDRA